MWLSFVENCVQLLIQAGRGLPIFVEAKVRQLFLQQHFLVLQQHLLQIPHLSWVESHCIKFFTFLNIHALAMSF
jgi:hypothetical protein